MLDLEPGHIDRVYPLFAELAALHGSVRAVLGDPAAGRVCVDDRQTPQFALLRGAEGLYLAGTPRPGQCLSGLRDAIHDWDYLYPGVSWLPSIHDALPHGFMVAHDRVRLTLKQPPAAQPLLPTGFALLPLGHMEFSVVHQHEIVSRCTLDMAVGAYAEIGVWTHPGFRGRGLARAAASASAAHAFASGIREIGWHCHTSNAKSLAIAHALGFEIANQYRAYSASLPAENWGDLSEPLSRSLAEHFESGSRAINWLGFHAAAAWVQVGDCDRALTCVESLVASGWAGKAEWLETHWALGRLEGEPRFVEAVRRQRVTAAPAAPD